MGKALELNETIEHALNHATLVEVESSNLNKVGFDDDMEALVVEFKNGGKFVYPSVSREEFDEMMDAESLGSYFGKNIRKLDYYKV